MTPENFQGIADLLPEPCFLIHSDGAILAANQAAVRTLQRSSDEIIAAGLFNLVSTPKKKIKDFLRSCSATSSRIIGSLDFRLPDKTLMSYRTDGARVHSTTDEQHPQIFLRCLSKQVSNDRFVELNKRIEQLNHEIQERERSARALEKSEAMLRSIIDNATAMISIKDLQGKYILCNRHFESLFHVDRRRLKSFTDFDIFPTDIASELRANDRRVIEKNTPIHSEESVPSEDGTHTYLSIKFPLYDADNNAYAVCSIASDITPIKRAEEKIVKFNRELETRVDERTEELVRAYKELEAFSYSVSHDLRAPLRSIDGFSKALIEDYANSIDDVGKDFLTRIRNASQRMGHLIDSLLQLSRIGRVELDYCDIDLTKLAHEVIHQQSEQRPDQKIVIRIQENLQTRGDKNLLEIVLDNLLGNAWKFASKQADARIEVGSKNSGTTTVFYVKDNGVGFDMNYADKLFGAFQRLHKESEFEGTGIGLATVQRIIHRHSGKIWAESEPGKGSTFYFTLGEARQLPTKQVSARRVSSSAQI